MQYSEASKGTKDYRKQCECLMNVNDVAVMSGENHKAGADSCSNWPNMALDIQCI